MQNNEEIDKNYQKINNSRDRYAPDNLMPKSLEILIKSVSDPR